MTASNNPWATGSRGEHADDAVPEECRALELLAPAGDRLCVTAAVENGADAVYFGLECGFNARARATNLHLDALPEVMSFLHERGVRGYVTLNTLVFPSELKTVEQHIVRLTEAGVDAVLVQDLGLVRLLRAVSPDLAVHASTQMTLTSGECIRAAEELGIERVVLARELSIHEIRTIRSQTSVELEVFVHGALCVAYSGQCLTSESLGGRSANRGQCAQACRLPYDLVCDGQDVDLGDVKYLLSPQDLAAYALVPELIDAGVSSFKIEGRLKTPEYVANITRQYRRALDAAAADRAADFTEQDVTEMELSFSRGFSPGWLGGCDHKMLVPGLSSAKRGVLVGEVKAVRGRSVVVAARRPVAPGDGVVFAGNREEGDEQGGRVYAVTPRGGGDIELAFGHGAIDFARLQPGQQLWKTDDPQLTAKLRKSFTGTKPQRRVALDLVVHAAVGETLRITGQAANGATCDVESTEPLAAANKHPLTHHVLEEQLGRLGGTVYELRNLRAEIVGEPMVPLSVLGKLRHEMIEQLAISIASRPTRRIVKSCESKLVIRAQESVSTDGPPTLRVLCRTLDQLNTAARSGCHNLIADFQDIRDYRAAVEAASRHGATIYLATPRIQKPGEAGIFRAMAKHGASGFLVRNLAGMAFCAEHGHSVRLRFLAQCREPVDGRLPANPRRRARDRFLRPEPRSTARSGRRGAARVAGSRHSPAHADVPHGALRVLRSALAGHEQNQLRPALRRSRGEAPRPRRHGTRAARRRRLPQHALQRRAAKCGRSRADAALPRPARFSHRAVVRKRRGDPQRHRTLPRSPRRPNRRQASLAAATRIEPRRRHPRHARRTPQPARDSVTGKN